MALVLTMGPTLFYQIQQMDDGLAGLFNILDFIQAKVFEHRSHRPVGMVLGERVASIIIAQFTTVRGSLSIGNK